VPVLFLGGEKDKGAPPEALAEAAQKVPNGEHVVIPAAGHISALENPAAVMEAIESWLSRHQ